MSAVSAGRANSLIICPAVGGKKFVDMGSPCVKNGFLPYYHVLTPQIPYGQNKNFCHFGSYRQLILQFNSLISFTYSLTRIIDFLLHTE
jgi:hypothetical protein